MAKKKPPLDTENVKKPAPEFKPGNKPHCQFGNEVLNQNVPWDVVLNDIEEKGYSLVTIASIAETTLDTLQNVLKQQFDDLSFRSGARIIGLHYRVCPSAYIEWEDSDEANA